MLLDRVEEDEPLELGEVCIDEVNCDACDRLMLEDLDVWPEVVGVLLDRVEEDEPLELGEVCLDEVTCDACDLLMLEDLDVWLEDVGVLLDRPDDDGVLLDRFAVDEPLGLGEVCLDEVTCDVCDRLMLEELGVRLEDVGALLERLDDDGVLLVRLEEEDDEERLEELDEDDRNMLHLKLVNEHCEPIDTREIICLSRICMAERHVFIYIQGDA